ncbi:ComEA family DNA-binding protein [Arsenophonus nasoniae]|uniref:ComE operon protein 1 n=2 Tax=Arsenophonus nasoniae TaxID=638 RepID=D2TWD1_9GAMM|nr:ComEA family DNA-binding protein [Arsenophonus nasoniae]QBY44883.1 ComE operon protein 1 [Arsenophonus nasoniae]WGL94581.1 ComEA family DNA-binding protein [Arsenophonus nasoniae]WGM01039.1 ComEA family DNA-binding protein [Arsenophonus nasoniae]WGM10137.1 ComEA family DNA-binding protein [Arsenophonus nasoniae]CBA71662.1 competence protein [Arsenophonus nasoniae]
MLLMIKKKIKFTTRILIFAIGFCHTALAQSDQLKVANDQPQTTTKLVINKMDNRQLMDDKVNINTASEEELAEKLNGVGLKKAQLIVLHRKKFGGFKSIEHLQDVPGIGLGFIEKNREKLTY